MRFASVELGWSPQLGLLRKGLGVLHTELFGARVPQELSAGKGRKQCSTRGLQPFMHGCVLCHRGGVTCPPPPLLPPSQVQQGGKYVWTGGGDHTLCQWFVKDYKFTKLMAFDLSLEGAGRLSTFGDPAAAGEAGSRPSSRVGSTRSAGGGSGGGSGGRGSVAGSKARSVRSAKTAKGGGGGGKSAGGAAAEVRKRPAGEDKDVFVKDIAFVCQVNEGGGWEGAQASRPHARFAIVPLPRLLLLHLILLHLLYLLYVLHLMGGGGY